MAGVVAGSDRESDRGSDTSDVVLMQTPKRTMLPSLVNRSKRILDSSSSESEGEGTTLRKKKTKSSGSAVGEDNLLEELKKTNAIMMDLAKKVKATERRVRDMEVEIKSQSSSSSSTPKRSRKRDVPDEVRVSSVCLVPSL